jgi:hypothetical protein
LVLLSLFVTLTAEPRFFNLSHEQVENGGLSKSYRRRRLVVTGEPHSWKTIPLTQRLSCDSFFAEDRFLSQTVSGFDFAAEHILHPGTVSWRSLYIETIGEEGQTSDFKRRPISAWSPFVGKLDVWEIARPQHQFYLSFLPEPKRDPTRWAVRQTALLTCELLGVSRKARRYKDFWLLKKKLYSLFSRIANPCS